MVGMEARAAAGNSRIKIVEYVRSDGGLESTQEAEEHAFLIAPCRRFNIRSMKIVGGRRSVGITWCWRGSSFLGR
jgi:hypothetical protein